MADQVVMDPVTGEYVQYHDGVEVRRWYGLAPMQNASASPGSVSGQPVSGTTTIGAQGEVVQPTAAPRDPLTAPPVESLTTPASTGSDAWYSSSPYTRRSSSGHSYGSSGSNGAYQSDPFANLPSYANGMQHPAQSGQPLVPGGSYRGPNPDQPSTGQQQVYVPGGAAAGPYETRAAPQPSSDGYGGGGASSAGGGGGGSSMGANSAIGQKLEGKVRGMAAKIQGGGSSSSDTSYMADQRQYDRTGKQIDRAYTRYNDALANPEPLPVRGWSKQQGYKPGTISAVLSDPTLLLNRAIPGYQSQDSPFSQQLESYPMTDLAMITQGTQGRGLLSRTPVTKVPGILRREAGVKPVRPEYKRTLDPSKVANQIAQMWTDLGTSGGDASWMNRENLLQDLATAKKKSALRQGLTQQFATDPNAGLASTRSYLTSALTAGPNDEITNTLYDTANRRITNLGDQLLTMKPKKASRFVTNLAGSFL